MPRRARLCSRGWKARARSCAKSRRWSRHRPTARRAAGLGVTHQIKRRGAHLGDGAWGGIQRAGPQCLNGIDGDNAGRAARFQGGQYVFDIGGGAQVQRRVRQVHARGAHPHLRHRLFAGDIDGMAAALGVFAQRLQDQGGLADTRIATHQQRRAGHKPPAGHPVEFGNAGRATLRRGILGLQVFQLKAPALGTAGRARSERRGDPLLHHGIPAVTGLAFARPFGRGGAAGLADEGGGGPGHA